MRRPRRRASCRQPRASSRAGQHALRDDVREHDLDETERFEVRGCRQREPEEPELRRERAEEPATSDCRHNARLASNARRANIVIHAPSRSAWNASAHRASSWRADSTRRRRARGCRRGNRPTRSQSRRPTRSIDDGPQAALPSFRPGLAATRTTPAVATTIAAAPRASDARRAARRRRSPLARPPSC